MSTLQTALFDELPSLIMASPTCNPGPRSVHPTQDNLLALSPTEAGIQKVDENTSEDWKALAEDAIRSVARTYPTITTDDVWKELKDSYPSSWVEAANSSAIGPAMRRAAKEGWIISTEDFKTSIRDSRHRNPLRVWKSLLFAEGESR